MGRRTLLLLTSLLIAAVGTALVAIYVKGADQRALKDVSAIQVLVAKDQIPANTGVDAVTPLTEQTDVMEREVLQGFTIRNAAELSKLKGRVLSAPVYPGQILDARMFQPATDNAASSTSQLTPGNVMMSVQMADPNRVAAYIGPGSQIAVFLSSGQPNSPDRKNQLLLDKARVVTVGNPVVTDSTATRSARANRDSVPTTIVTLDVPQKAAQKLFYAQTAGEMFFALRNDASSVKPDSVDDKNLFTP